MRAILEKEPKTKDLIQVVRDELMRQRFSIRSLASVNSFVQKLKRGYTVGV